MLPHKGVPHACRASRQGGAFDFKAPGLQFLLSFFFLSNRFTLRKLLFIAVLLPILAALGWWYFREQSSGRLRSRLSRIRLCQQRKEQYSQRHRPAHLRTGEDASTWAANRPAVAANAKKNEVYVVNAGSNNVSVIDAETNTVVATIGVYGRPYYIDVSQDGKRAYVANSARQT